MELRQPGANLLGRSRMMHFHNEPRLQRGEQLWPAAKNLVIATFHVDLDQLRRRTARGNKIVQRERRNADECAISEHGALSVRFHTAMRCSCSRSSLPEGDTVVGCAGPNGRAHHLKASLQVIAYAHLFEPRPIAGIWLKSHNPTRWTDQLCHAKRYRSEVRPYVVSHIPWPQQRGECLLHVRLVSSGA